MPTKRDHDRVSYFPLIMADSIGAQPGRRASTRPSDCKDWQLSLEAKKMNLGLGDYERHSEQPLGAAFLCLCTDHTYKQQLMLLRAQRKQGWFFPNLQQTCQHGADALTRLLESFSLCPKLFYKMKTDILYQCLGNLTRTT